MAVNFINKYPYTDFHELNLDWVIKELSKKAAGRWATITIHPDEWDGDGLCTVTGITGLDADTPILWSWAPNTIENTLVDNFVYPVGQRAEELTFFSSGIPDGDVTINVLIGG